jgi:hypothetical protein
MVIGAFGPLPVTMIVQQERLGEDELIIASQTAINFLRTASTFRTREPG